MLASKNDVFDSHKEKHLKRITDLKKYKMYKRERRKS